MPAEIGRLFALQTLDLSNCKQLLSLPAEIGHLIALKKLMLTTCEQLESLPDEIGQLERSGRPRPGGWGPNQISLLMPPNISSQEPAPAKSPHDPPFKKVGTVAVCTLSR